MPDQPTNNSAKQTKQIHDAIALAAQKNVRLESCHLSLTIKFIGEEVSRETPGRASLMNEWVDMLMFPTDGVGIGFRTGSDNRTIVKPCIFADARDYPRSSAKASR